MRRFLTILLALMLVGTAPAAAKDMPLKDDGSKYKIFVQDVRLAGIAPEYAQIYSSFISEAIHELGMFEVVTSQDLQEMADYEAVKEILACDSVSCLAQIGGAAVADLMLTSNISKFPDNISVALNLSNVDSMKKINTITEMLLDDKIYKVNQLLPLQTKQLFAEYLTEEQIMGLKKEIAKIKNSDPTENVAENTPNQAAANEIYAPAENPVQKETNKAPLSPALKAERTAAITTGIIGGVAIITGAIMSGMAVHNHNFYTNNFSKEYSPFPGAADMFRMDVKDNNKLAVTGTVTWATGTALAVTSLALGIDFALKNKAPKVVALPTINQNVAGLTLSYRW